MDVAICEFVDNRGLTLSVDAAAGVVKNVKVLGSQSQNGRTYTEQAMRQALPLYEGSKVYLNHPVKAGEPRRVEDRFGEMRGVSYRPGEGLFAEQFIYNPKHPFAEAFAWNAEHAPHALGFSHNVTGRTSVKDGKTVVEAITKVASVDLVAEPATTRGLHESIEPGEPTVEITLEAVRSKPEIVAAILKEHASSEAAKARDAEFQKLKEEVDGHRAAAKLAAKKATVAQAIAEAKLPKEAVSDTFVELCEAADEAGLAKLIAERVTLSKSLKVATPQSKEQQVTEGAGSSLPADSKELVKRWS